MYKLLLIPYEKESSVFLLLSYLYVLRTREAVLCYLGSVCQWWMTEIMWFLSILILTGAPFQKGQEWRSKKSSRECFITRLENMKQFNPLDCPWLLSKAAYPELRTLPRIQSSRTAAGPMWCSVWEHLQSCGGWEPGLAEDSSQPGRTRSIVCFRSLMWRTLLCTLELFVNHHTFVDWSSDSLGGPIVLIIRHSVFIESPLSVIQKILLIL